MGLVQLGLTIFFTLEYALRLLVSRHRLRFLYQPLNIIDVITILPFYFTFFLQVKRVPLSYAVMALLSCIFLCTYTMSNMTSI